VYAVPQSCFVFSGFARKTLLVNIPQRTEMIGSMLPEMFQKSCRLLAPAARSLNHQNLLSQSMVAKLWIGRSLDVGALCRTALSGGLAQGARGNACGDEQPVFTAKPV
jgi:hypothetical protein